MMCTEVKRRIENSVREQVKERERENCCIN